MRPLRIAARRTNRRRAAYARARADVTAAVWPERAAAFFSSSIGGVCPNCFAVQNSRGRGRPCSARAAEAARDGRTAGPDVHEALTDRLIAQLREVEHRIEHQQQAASAAFDHLSESTVPVGELVGEHTREADDRGGRDDEERDQQLVGRGPHRVGDAEPLDALLAVAVDRVDAEVDPDRQQQRWHRDEYLVERDAREPHEPERPDDRHQQGREAQDQVGDVAVGDREEDEDEKQQSEHSSDTTNNYAKAKKRVNVVRRIPVKNIRSNPLQPRTHFDKDRLKELADSIDRHGLIQPITVRHLGDDRFELISGERRLRASKMAGKKEVAAYIRKVEDDDLLAYALIENIQREELNPIEVAQGYERLMEECEYTQEEVAEKVGKNRSTVTNMLRLLNLPDFIQAALKEQQITMGHARALISIEDTEMQKKLLEKTIENNYSVRKVEKEVRRLKKKEKEVNTDSQKEKKLKAQYRDIADRLRNVLSTKVDIKPKKKGGEIRIEYYSDEELNRLLDLFDAINS